MKSPHLTKAQRLLINISTDALPIATRAALSQAHAACARVEQAETANRIALAAALTAAGQAEGARALLQQINAELTE